MASNQYPYVGKAIMRYQSEEAGDLSFEAEQLIKVLGPSPSDPEYQNLGETLDGESQGSFPKEFVEKVDESEQEHQSHPAEPSASLATSALATSISSPSPPPSAATPISIPQATDDESKPIPSDIAASSPPKTAPIDHVVSPTSGHLPPISPIDTSVPKVTPAPSVPTSETDMPENPLIKTPPEETASSPLPSNASAVDKEKLTLPSATSVISSSSANTALKPPPSPSKAPSAPSSPGAVKVGGMSSSDAAQTIGKGSLAARMAMFQNKDKEAAPAPVPRAPRQPWKPKPAPETPASSSALPTPSPAAARATSPSAPISSPRRDPVPSSHSDAPSSPAGAMSADDAKASIKVGGSLKERMAALQGALGSGAQAAPPPVPAGKPKVWKRPVAAEPVVTEPAPEKPKSKWVVEEDKGEEGGRVEKSGEDFVAPAQEVEKGDGGDEKEAEGQKEEITKDAAPAEEEPAEDDEEAAEKARRAAIAARMAKIGARGPMGMMQAPKPVAPPKRQESATSAASESESSPSTARPVPTPFAAAAQPLAAAEPSSPTSEHDDEHEPSEHASVPMTPANTEQQSGAQMSTPLPAMPRRAAPPRRKNQTPKASDPVTADPPLKLKTAEEEELEREEETIGKAQGGAEGAVAAGIALEEVEQEEQNVDGQQEKPFSPLVIPQTLPETKTLSSDPDALEDSSAEPFHEPIQHQPQSHQAAEADADEERDEVRQPQRQTSIPIPKRDHAHTEDEAEFRAADELTEALKTGQPVIGPPATESDEHGGKDASVAPPPPPRNSLPPPPPNAARQLESDAEEEDEEDELEEEGAVDEEDEATVEEIEAENEAEAIPSPLPPRRHHPSSTLPPLPVVEPKAERNATKEMPGLEDIDGADAAEEDEEEALPPPRRTTLPPPPPVSESKEEEEKAQLGYLQEPEDSMRQDDDEEATPPPPPARRPSVPSGPRERPPSMVATSSTAVMEDVSSTVESATLVRKPSTGGSRPPVPRGLPPTPITTSFEEDAPVATEPTGLVRRGSMRSAVHQGLPATSIEEDQPSVSPLAQRSPLQIPAASPIEPSSQQPSEPASASAPEVDEEDEEAVEAARRQTIAARMAKLGGANQMRLFGGPPPVLPRKPAGAEDASPADAGSAQEQKEKTEESGGELKEPEEELDEEEADRQRRARVMAKMQSGAMGGVRFGMGGFGAPTPPPAAPMLSKEEQSKEVEEQPIESPAIDQPSPPASLARRPSVPVSRPLPPQPTDTDTSFPPITTESIVDEPTYFDAPSQSVPSVDLTEDDAPPPPPARPARAVPPPTINTTSIPTLDSLDLGSPLAVDSFTASPSSTSISPSPSQPHAQQQQETFQPPSPVAPPERRASTKRLSSLLGRSSSRNNSVDLGRQGSSGRGSMEISRQSIDQGGRPMMEERSSSAQPQEQTIREDGGDGPSVGELKELARKFGPIVLRNAEHLLSQAKKASIGDGSPSAFVSEVLYASHCFSSPPYGHLIHYRSASDILIHRDDVHSGDVVSLSGCHFKGKKGLVGYHEDVDEALGVVLEFEGGKKEKMKVGMVVRGKGGDSNLYRLDDLKSGEIKFYRPRSA